MSVVSKSASGRRSAGLLLALLVLVAIGLHAPLLRDGHEWSDDFAQYIAHAHNILAYRPYGDTGYIPNPWAIPGPTAYPPIYPLLIAPLLALWGDDLHVLKLFGVLTLAAAIAACVPLLARHAGRRAALGIAAAFMLSPFFVGFRDEVRPDALFLLFTMLALWLAERWGGGPALPDRRAVLHGLLLGLVAWLAYGTRSVGIVILPALALWELTTRRRLSGTLLVSGALWLALAVLQKMWMQVDNGYANLIRFDAQTIVGNLKAYLLSLSILFHNGLPAPFDRLLRAALFAAASLFAAIGYLVRLRRGPGVIEFFAPLYMVPLAMYWVGTMIQQRYVLPLLPLYLFWAWEGLRWSAGRWPALPWRAIRAALGGAALLAILSGHLNAPRGPIDPGISNAAAQGLLQAVRERTPPDAVVLSGRARAVALYTGRTGISPYGYRSDEELWGLIRDHRVSHLMIGLGPLAIEMDYEHPDDLARFVAAHAERFDEAYANDEFRLMTVRSLPEATRR